MADSKGSDGVANYVLLFTTDLSSFTCTINSLLGYEVSLTSLFIDHQIVHWTNTTILAIFFEQGLHVLERLQVELGPFHRHLLKDHVILSERASFVSEEELDAAELFWDGRITWDRVCHILIFVDAVRVVDFSHVQIDSQGDGDNR